MPRRLVLILIALGLTMALTAAPASAGAPQATLLIEKQTVPDGAGDLFAFTTTIPGLGIFQLSDGTVFLTLVDQGTYTVTETALAGWTLTDITCTESGTLDSTDAGNTATITAQPGESIECVFTNTSVPPTPTPAASLADAAMADPATSSPLGALGLGLLLLGSLGTLAFANTRRR